MSFLVTQGETDEIFPLRIIFENYEYLRKHAAAVKYIVYPSGHEVTVDMQRGLVSWIANDVSVEKVGN